MNSTENEYMPLQSLVFGHRFKANQSFYEYILEFLIVVFSEKEVGNEYVSELFPKDIDKNSIIKYRIKNNVGLKRFVFFEKSKLEGRFSLDKKAYDEHISLLKNKIQVESNRTSLSKDQSIELMQDLLYGFSAVLENRSWFAQSLLPICKHTLMPEIMGEKGVRNKEYDFDEYKKVVDGKFQTNRYNFMARGGEVYYLHLLSAVNHYPEYREKLECGFNLLINQFKELEHLCEKIQDIWIKEEEIELKYTVIDKKLGYIPDGFENREKKTLEEVINILYSDMHPFEKIEVLANGIIIQILIMCYEQARKNVGKDKGYLIFDINCYKGMSHEEVKKLSVKNYQSYEQDILDVLYANVKNHKNKDKAGNYKNEEETMRDAIDDTLKVFKKLGKKIGIIRPINEIGIRFTLNEEILKYFVLSLVKPNSKITFDRFLEKLYENYGIVIGYEQLLKADERYLTQDMSYLNNNKLDLQRMLKDIGFLRELSDSTSIVENPYLEVENEKVSR